MKIAVFSTRSYDREFLAQAAATDATFNSYHQFAYYDVHLRPETIHLAEGHDAVCVFVNDQLDRVALENLKALGVQLVALRCAGYNNVDLIAANDLGISVARVPAYSPGLDVYEEETELFFEDLSLQVIPDDVFSRLLTLPNVVITGHQAFLTREALEHIAQTTIDNIVEFAATRMCRNQVRT
jgi:lactate dehydrogenase-like 2-hydroxyacid dehydrogenase